MKKRIAVILSGCGAKDGSEIHEATLTLYALSCEGAHYEIFAPDAPQRDVINHYTNTEQEENRNVLVEAARIARGDISPLTELDPDRFDALIIPGGFGAAKNLFTFAFDGLDFSVNQDVETLLNAFHNSGKPIGAICVAPVMLAKVFGSKGVELTVGVKGDLAEGLEEKFGAKVVKAGHTDAIVDKKNKIVTTPAYMYDDNNIGNVGKGIAKLVKDILKM